MIHYFEDMAVNPLLLTGLLGGALAGVGCGLMGPYVVTRRIVFLAGAIAHTVVGGVGAAIFLRHQFPETLGGLVPIHGALAAALISAVILAYVQHYARERLDTLIGALWSAGMATGLLLVKYTPGYQADLLTYLFGNLAFVDGSDVALIASVNVVLLAVLALFHKRFLAIGLDEEHARLQGVSVLGANVLLLALVALTVVALTRVVGLILVIALLSLPAATAAHFARRMSTVIAVSVGLSVALTTAPRIALYGTRVSPESAIVLSSCVVYLAALGWRRIRVRNNAGLLKNTASSK